jgi:hypothetical protein
MSNTMLAPDPHAVKHGRFVAPTAEAQEAAERELGRKAYRDGKRRAYCFTEAMTAGWDEMFDAGRQVYARAMLAEAVN